MALGDWTLTTNVEEEMSTKTVVVIATILLYVLIATFSALIIVRLEEIKVKVSKIEISCGCAEAEGFGAVDAGDQRAGASRVK